MDRLIKIVCFYFPFVNSCLYLQVTVSKFASHTLAQLIAYLNLVLVLGGVFLLRKKIGELSSTNRLFFIFYVLYYSFGILASGMTGFQTSIIATFVPVIYFIGFYYFLSNKEHFNEFFKVMSVTFVVSAFLTIILIKLNINVYSGEVHGWAQDRAGGVTGDANAAAHTSIFAFIFFNQLFKPTKPLFKAIKIIILSIIFYSLTLTFSTTGLFVFTIVFFLINYKFFQGIRLIILAAAIPLFYGFIFYLKGQVSSLDLSVAQTDKVNNIINLLTLNFDEVDNSGRGDLVENALMYINNNPILGNGVDFSVDKLVHNTYVGVWVDAGIFTFLFFLILLANYFIRALSTPTNIKFYAISIMVVLCIFMISLQSVINQPYLIVLFVFVGYLIDHNRSEEV